MDALNEAIVNLTNVLSGPRELALDIICDYVESSEADSVWLTHYLLPKMVELTEEGLGRTEPSDAIYGRTFALAVLACLAERDAKTNLMSADQRRALIQHLVKYLQDERDYRGYVNNDHGWAHSVAHAADLSTALIQNGYIDSIELNTLFEQWQQLLKSDKLPFLIFDEDQRLAMALKSAIDAGRFNALTLAVFFDELLDDEEDDWFHFAFRSKTALNRFKNIQNLVRSLYLQVQLDNRSAPKVDMLTVLQGLLRKLDSGFYPS